MQNVFSINGAGSIRYSDGGKKQILTLSIPNTKINQKWIADLNVKGKIQLLEENIGMYLHDLKSKKRFLKQTQKAIIIKDE